MESGKFKAETLNLIRAFLIYNMAEDLTWLENMERERRRGKES
jgi:hypothetical protein